MPHASHPSQWLYCWPTKIGDVWIAPQPGARDRVWLGLGDEALGSYASPRLAADDAAGGHSGDYRLDNLISQGRIQIPEDVKEWNVGQLLRSLTR